MSKKTDQKFLEKQHKRIEIISHLSAIAGPYDAARINMSVIAWGNDSGEYWLRLLDIDGQGDKLLIHIDSETASSRDRYYVHQYISEHGIDHAINSWSEFMEDDAA